MRCIVLWRVTFEKFYLLQVLMHTLNQNRRGVLQCVAVCCSVLQCVAVSDYLLQLLMNM